MNKRRKHPSQDKYAYGMDWGEEEVSIGTLNNYRRYQYDLVANYLGINILEVGSGASRSFSKLIVENLPAFDRLLSIEPSQVLWEKYEKLGKFKFPRNVEFRNMDLFDLNSADTGQFDTILFIHVLEHIEDDRGALGHAYDLLDPGGKVLIEVPALPILFSVHDKMLGHYRRYNKAMLRKAIDPDKYLIKKMWYNDPIGVLGSLYFFKFQKIQLKSAKGINTVKTQGQFFDRIIIPIQKQVEKIFTFPFGLSLNAVLEKK